LVGCALGLPVAVGAGVDVVADVRGSVGVGVGAACPATVPALADVDRVVRPMARQNVATTSVTTMARGTSSRDVEDSPGMVGDRLVRLSERLVGLV
jgi:hypothetical protein